MSQVLRPEQLEEDLREYYITPEYLRRMQERAQNWTTEFLKTQARLFHKTLPDYPELKEVLESELHKRNLNRLLRAIRKNPKIDLRALLEKYKDVPDYAEVIRTEMEIRSGAARLRDPTGGKGVQIV